MRFFSLFSILILWTHHALGANILPIPRLPSEDPFYKPPTDTSWKVLPPGSILKSRNVTIGSLIPHLPSLAKAYQLLYVTRDVNEQPAVTVTTIIVPQNPDLDRILSLQSAYDAPDINCSPSYGLQYQVEGPAATWNRGQLSFVLPYLRDGPILNMPDYEGSNAAFTVGPQSAYQTLDSIRAVLNSEHITGVSPDASTVMFGYSGGAYATEWASEFHATYAPELNIAGAAMGGPPPNITNTYLNVNNGTLSELNVWAMLGVMNAYPEMDRYMRAHLLDEYKDSFLYPLTRCSPREGIPQQPPLANTDISAFFDNGHQFLYEFKEILEQIGVMGKRVEKGTAPNFPLFIYQGTSDEVTGPIGDTHSLVKRFREAGTQVVYIPYVGHDHSSTLIAGMSTAWWWITRRFNKAALLDEEELLRYAVQGEEGGRPFVYGSNLPDQILLGHEAARKPSCEL